MSYYYCSFFSLSFMIKLTVLFIVSIRFKIIFYWFYSLFKVIILPYLYKSRVYIIANYLLNKDDPVCLFNFNFSTNSTKHSWFSNISHSSFDMKGWLIEFIVDSWFFSIGNKSLKANKSEFWEFFSRKLETFVI